MLAILVVKTGGGGSGSSAGVGEAAGVFVRVVHPPNKGQANKAQHRPLPILRLLPMKSIARPASDRRGRQRYLLVSLLL
jgi:uncharacterized protein YggU (UPF0235/DUF167 family)